MDPYISDWLNLVIRFLHVITGIAWIGASFYFIWLDNALREPPEWKKQKGIKGDVWAIHGGGIYEVAKYRLAPEQMPAILHWFKWEAYSTGITGFLLLSLIYYVGANTYLIDPSKAAISPWLGILIGIGALASGWFIYDYLCKTPLVKKGLPFAVTMIAILTLFTFLLSLVFSDRAVYIHVGAMIGISMVLNVLTVIMPSQRALVDAIERGVEPDEQWALNAKLRSTHNNYATLPVIFIMISNHYPMTYGHQYGWLVLAAIIAITMWARHFFNLKHREIIKPYILATAALAFVGLVWALAPSKAATTAAQPVSNAAAIQIVQQRCATCHSSHPTDDVFKTAPAGVMFDDPAQIEKWAARIKARAVDSKDMPFMNKTHITEEERSILGQWASQQH